MKPEALAFLAIDTVSPSGGVKIPAGRRTFNPETINGNNELTNLMKHSLESIPESPNIKISATEVFRQFFYTSQSIVIIDNRENIQISTVG